MLTIPEVWNEPETIQKRSIFVSETMTPLMHRPKYYIDEQGFNLHVKRSKGRAPAGQPARLTVVPKGPRVSLIACLGAECITS